MAELAEAARLSDPALPPETARRLQQELHATIGLDRLLAVERTTVEQ